MQESNSESKRPAGREYLTARYVMPVPVLFVVGQGATVAYLAPIWRRWLKSRKINSWRVLANSVAAQRIEYELLDGLPMIKIESDSAVEVQRSLSGWRPECLVMSASFAQIERAAILFAEQKRIPVARIIDTWYGYRRRLVWAGGEVRLPDRLLVIDDTARLQAIAEGIPSEIIEVVGQPAWEHIECFPQGDRRDILFVSQPIERFYGSSLGYTEKTVWRLFSEVMDSHPEFFRKVYYAAHPDDDMLAPIDSRVEVVESGVEALRMVGCVVGMFSSLVADALLSGRHVVSFQPGAQGQRLCVLGSDSFVPRALTSEELVVALLTPSAETSDLRRSLIDSADRVEKFCIEFSSRSWQ